MKKLLFVALATAFSTTMFAQAAKKKLYDIPHINFHNVSQNESRKIKAGIENNINVAMPISAGLKSYAKIEGIEPATI